ncbi:putative diguanylate cyclase YdaM [Thiorhodovibrio winogradskyi]|uniref:Diguanylate cyclase YdaM n=1 Tax=Thiorhodovibrio winogradskyi TaxID=77007 RepID=A0ABZ0S539_9GAMM|nr:diguanylate cyclase [Thiorhodovibrio winogradskyi]
MKPAPASHSRTATRASRFAATLLFAVATLSANPAPDAERPVRLCIDPDWAPFEYLDDQDRFRGMSADYWQRMSERAGLATELVVTKSWQESLDKAKARECDLLTLAMKTPERTQHWLFTTPYVSYPFVLVTRSEIPAVDSLEAVADKTLAAVSGYAYTELVRTRYPSIGFIEVSNVAEGLEKVRRGEAYGMLDSLATVATAIRAAKLHELKIAGRFTENWELAIAVRNDRPDWLPFFETMVDSLTEEDHREIENRWLAAWIEAPADLRWLKAALAIVLAFGLIAGFFIWRQAVMRRQAKALEQINTALRQARDRAEKSEQRYAELARQSRSIAWDVDLDGSYTDVSESVETVLGYRPEQLIGRPFWDIMPAANQERMRRLGLTFIREGRSIAGFENQLLDNHGRALWVTSSGIPLHDDQGQIIGFRGIDMDIDERYRQRDLLQRYAFFDGLTEVANRRLFLDRLSDAIARYERHGAGFALLSFDLDHFKEINDNHGHAAGDAVLRGFAEQASGCLRQGDLLARLGGEEFAALLLEADLEGALQTATRIRQRIEATPVTFGNKAITVTVSIGATLMQPGDDSDSLLARVDSALYQAKRTGRNRVVIREIEPPQSPAQAPDQPG